MRVYKKNTFAQEIKLKWLYSGVIRLLLALIYFVMIFAFYEVFPFIGEVAYVQSLSAGLAAYLITALLLLYVLFILSPAVLILPLVLPLGYRWHLPRRIVVFRRFNLTYENKQLQNIIRRNLTRNGHVFTLADSRIHLPLSVKFPLLLGQLGWLNFRAKKITSMRRLNTFRRLLNNRVWLNVNWFISSRKIFSVRTSDEYWQDSVKALIEHADLVVMDISNPRSALEWEVKETRKQLLNDRIIFLCDSSKAIQARKWLSEIGNFTDSQTSRQLFEYSKNGLSKASEFSDLIAHILESPLRTIPKQSITVIGSGVLRFFAAAIIVAKIAISYAAPQWFPNLTIRFSPFPRPIIEAYLYSVPMFGEEGSSALALERLQNNFPHQATPLLIEYAKRNDQLSQRAVSALCLIGDTRAFEPLVKMATTGAIGEVYLGRRMDIFEKPQTAAKKCLRYVVKRLGDKSYIRLLEAMSEQPDYPPDPVIIHAIEPSINSEDITHLESWLKGDTMTGRFIGGIALAKSGDADGFARMLNTIDFFVVFGGGDSEAKEAATYLAVKYADEDFIRSLIVDKTWNRAYPGNGPSEAILKALVTLASQDAGSEIYARALLLLNSLDEKYLQYIASRARLSPYDTFLELSANYALFLRTNTIPMRSYVRCFSSSLSRYCAADEARKKTSLSILDKIASLNTAYNSLKFDFSAEPDEKIPHDGFIHLANALAAAANDDALKILIAAYAAYPDALKQTDIGNFSGIIPARLLPWISQIAKEEKNALHLRRLQQLANDISDKATARI